MIAANVDKIGSAATIEMIIVNDSPWITVEVPSGENQFQIRVLNIEKNVGIQGARIRGLIEARGEYVLMLDQDDEITDEFLKETFVSIKNADVCVSNGELIRPRGNKPIYLSDKKQRKVSNVFLYVYLENRILSPGHCLIKKESIPHEWMNNALKYNGADDLVLWILMLCQNKKFTYVTKKMYKHIDTGDNVSADEMNMAESTYEACEVLSRIAYVPRWIPLLLRRKINNDVYFIQNGRDKYLDYKMIELLRKTMKRTRD